jgi:hypothetical protein
MALEPDLKEVFIMGNWKVALTVAALGLPGLALADGRADVPKYAQQSPGMGSSGAEDKSLEAPAPVQPQSQPEAQPGANTSGAESNYEYGVQTTNESVSQNREKRVGVELNGGIGEFTGDVASRTSLGPSYGATLSYRTDPMFAAELGYQGAANAINGGGTLTSNKVQLDGKLGPELSTGIAWRPYVYAGIAANFVGANANRQGLQSTTLGQIPLGGGADFFTRAPIHLGARAGYDWNPGVGGAVLPFVDEHPSTWQASLTAQGSF